MSEADLREAEREVQHLTSQLQVRKAQVAALRKTLGKQTDAEQEAADDAPKPDGEWASTLDFVANRRNGFRWGAEVTKSERGTIEVTMPVSAESGAGAGTGGGVHGGFLAALVDMAGVSAAFTRSGL